MILSSNDVYIVKLALSFIIEDGKSDHRIFVDAKKLLEEMKFRDNEEFSFSRNSQFKDELHITEQKYPEQIKRFREILEEMYQVMLDKNRDYSASNILMSGMVGVSVRIFDKCIRIMSLLGWDIQTGEYSSERKSANDESIEDNLKDLGVYSIIARILREGKWGK